jgi:hypothetical protein
MILHPFAGNFRIPISSPPGRPGRLPRQALAACLLDTQARCAAIAAITVAPRAAELAFLPYDYHEGVTRRPGPTYDAGMTRRGEEGAAPDRVVLTGGPLGLAEVVAVARRRVPVELGEEGRKGMAGARDVVERAVAEGRRVYGVSTGFGLLANTVVDPADLEELQRRIVLSHATATGDPLDVEVVRGMQLLRARTLTQGYSGVRPVVVDALVALLAAGVTPVIPEHGSVGASGDLAQLAHLALPLLG